MAAATLLGGGGAVVDDPEDVSTWPGELAELVALRSQGALRLAEDDEVRRHLVATRDLAAHEPVLTESAILCGSDDAPSLRIACRPEDAEGMMEAWERPEGGGSNPLAHFDLFCRYTLEKARAKKAAGRPSDAAARLDRVARWFCRPEEGDDIDRQCQAEKLKMLLGALRPELRRMVSLEELQRFDDVLTRNAEEFTGAPSILLTSGESGRPPAFGRRRFQGIFPCKDLIQHSCEPNCMTVAGPAGSGLKMHIVPLRPIKAGEQLTWNYLPYWKQLWPTQLRRQALREGWHFHCRCRRCSGGDSAPELTMQFRCPGCDKGELCPATPCAVEEPAGAGHVASLRSVSEMVCRSCELRIHRDIPEGSPHAGYVERCVAQEAVGFSLPWRGVRGRDFGAVDPGMLDLMAEHHWVHADHASHELENGPAILAEDLDGARPQGTPRTELVRKALDVFAEAAERVASALVRFLGHSRSVALPELQLTRAICTGSPADWDACLQVHITAFRDLPAVESTMAAARCLAESRRSFFEHELARQPQAAAELFRHQPFLEQEEVLVRQWVPAALPDNARDPSADLETWSLRRMWLCPDVGWTPPDEEGEEEKEEEGAEEEEPGASASVGATARERVGQGPTRRRLSAKTTPAKRRRLSAKTSPT